MSLSRFEREALVHRGAERNLVEHADVYSRYGNRTALAAAHDRFAQDVRAIGAYIGHLLKPVDPGIKAAANVRFGSDCIDTPIRAATLSHIVKVIEDAGVLEVNGFRFAEILRHLKPLRHAIDG